MSESLWVGVLYTQSWVWEKELSSLFIPAFGLGEAQRPPGAPQDLEAEAGEAAEERDSSEAAVPLRGEHKPGHWGLPHCVHPVHVTPQALGPPLRAG